MSNIEQQYLDLLLHVIEHGEDRDDRTKVGTRSIFGATLTADLSEHFPLLTSKLVPWDPVKGELLWFIEGSSDERRLADITHGTRDKKKTTIWTANANADYWKPKAEFDGDVGRIYGVQWRTWKRYTLNKLNTEAFGFDAYDVDYIDQLNDVINTIKNDPTSRRIIMSALNVAEYGEMSLPPCHCFVQFYVRDDKLDAQVYMRSVDMFLGLPFNIASYALLVCMIAQVTNLKPGKLRMLLGDTHVYQNHFDQVFEQLSRDPYKLPKLKLNKDVKFIEDFKMTDITLDGYKHHPIIKAPMAV